MVFRRRGRPRAASRPCLRLWTCDSRGGCPRAGLASCRPTRRSCAPTISARSAATASSRPARARRRAVAARRAPRPDGALGRPAGAGAAAARRRWSTWRRRRARAWPRRPRARCGWSARGARSRGGPPTVFATLNPVNERQLRGRRRRGRGPHRCRSACRWTPAAPRPGCSPAPRRCRTRSTWPASAGRRREGADDVLWVSGDGYALEAPTSTLVWLTGRGAVHGAAGVDRDPGRHDGRVPARPRRRAGLGGRRAAGPPGRPADARRASG